MMRMNNSKEEEREIGRQMEMACMDGMEEREREKKVQSDQNVVTKSILWKENCR